MFTIIKTLNNYLILTNTIQTEKIKYATLQEQIAYTQRFMEPYLLSDFSPYFLGHENGRYLPWEVVVVFGATTQEDLPNTESISWAVLPLAQTTITYRPASEEWKYLIELKWRLLHQKLFF